MVAQVGRDDVDDYCAFVREETDLRLGIEADFVAGREDRIAALPGGARVGLRRRAPSTSSATPPSTSRARIGSTCGAAATARTGSGSATSRRSPRPPAAGLYDIMAHPDLVKVWGSARPQPERDPRHYYEPAVEAMLEAGVAAMEMSTAGLRKPVGELYPRPRCPRWPSTPGCRCLSSDAHVPDQLGYRYDDAVAALTAAGVKELCVFERRERRMEPIGDPLRPRHRHARLRRRPPADPRRHPTSRTRRGSPATRTPTSSPTR